MALECGREARSVTEKSSNFSVSSVGIQASGCPAKPSGLERFFWPTIVLGLPCNAKAFLDNVETYREAVAKGLERLPMKSSVGS